MKVAEIVCGGTDSVGTKVLQVYVKRPPRFAIYRTAERVVVHYADSEIIAAEQAALLAKLSPARGVINSLVDGWRRSWGASKKVRADLFDRQVADALHVALEGDPGCAQEQLDRIRAEVMEMRVSWARQLYLVFAAGAVVVTALAAALAGSPVFRGVVIDGLPVAALAGALGAFFSIAVGIRRRTVLPDLRSLDNAADAVLRVLIGTIAGMMLTLLLKSQLLTSAVIDLSRVGNIELAVVIAFTAGFLERLVPDLLERTGKDIETPPAQVAQDAAKAGAQPTASAPAAAAAAPAAAPAAGAAAAMSAAAAADLDEVADHCACDRDHDDSETMDDHELPVAIGGVERAA